MEHHLFTIITSVRPGQAASLKTLLDGLAVRQDTKVQLGFTRLPQLHYASMFLFEDFDEGESLVLEFNIDGDINSFITDFAHATDRDLIGQVYGHCQAFETTAPDALADYLRHHVVLPQAAYVGNVGRSQQRIQDESNLYNGIQRHLADMAPETDESKIAQSILNYTQKNFPHLLTTDASIQRHKKSLMDYLELLARAVFFVVLAVLLLPFEQLARIRARAPSPDHVRQLETREDWWPTNHMVNVVYIRPGWLRQLAVRNNFALLQVLVRLMYQKGELGGIPSIHYAHWALLHGGRRLLFVSNYDGSWDSYLEDFIMKAAKGLTLAWSQSYGFPRSYFIVFGGAADGPHFKDFGRRFMFETSVWYNAYPNLSVQNVERNTEVRQGLVRLSQGIADTSWLQKL